MTTLITAFAFVTAATILVRSLQQAKTRKVALRPVAIPARRNRRGRS